MKIYRYLFYRAYDLVKMTGTYDRAWGASHFLSLFFSLLTMDLMIIFNVEKRMKLEVFGLMGVVIFIIFHVINYFMILRENKYKVIIDKFSAKEPQKYRNVARVFVIVVTMLLVWLLF